jgi:flagellar hook-length control protein FliK
VAPTALADASAKAAGDLATAPLPASPGAATLAGDAAAKAGATPRNLAANAVDKVPGASQVAAANNAATSARTGAAGSANPATGSPWMNDAATQAVNTAALSAAATGVVAASKTDAADMDDLATAATGTAAQAAQVSGGTAVVAPPITAARPASIVSASVLAAASSRATAQTAALISASSDKHYASGSADAVSDAGSDSSAAAAQLSVGSTPSSDATAVPTLKVAAGVDTPEFGQGLSERVSWMLDNNVSSAKLQVNPPQLGPIEVRIALQGDHAQVWLTSHSAVTRDALESSAPKLREMLGAQGFGQVSVDISQRSFQERSTQPQPYDWTPAAVRAPASAAQSTAGPLPRRTSSGAVDAYA